MVLTPRQKKIYEDQDTLLIALKKIKPFPYVLSGGTALSRFYFHHRFSEDLDFFCEQTTFSFEKVEGIVNRLRRSGLICELVGRADQTGRLKVASYAVRQRRRFSIKVDFMEDPFSGMWKPVLKTDESGIRFRVDALDQIFYRKFYSLVEQRVRTGAIHRMKDLADLYTLHQFHRSLEKTILFFRKNHVPIEEEKLIMIFSELKKSELEEGLQILSSSFKGKLLWKTFRQCADNLLKEGLQK